MTFSDDDVNIKNLQDGKSSKIDFKNLIAGNKNDAINLMKNWFTTVPVLEPSSSFTAKEVKSK